MGAGGTEMKLSILLALITKLIILTPKTCSKSRWPQTLCEMKEVRQVHNSGLRVKRPRFWSWLNH